MQIVEQSEEEQMAMYMKLPKRELVKILMNLIKVTMQMTSNQPYYKTKICNHNFQSLTNGKVKCVFCGFEY
jgi:hypothetical protein